MFCIRTSQIEYRFDFTTKVAFVSIWKYGLISIIHLLYQQITAAIWLNIPRLHLPHLEKSRLQIDIYQIPLSSMCFMDGGDESFVVYDTMEGKSRYRMHSFLVH